MSPRRSAGASLLALVLTATVPTSSFADTTTATRGPGQDKPGHFSFAVIGDVPYGADQVAAFPRWVDQINAADPELAFHLGDIKNGSTRCDDGYYRMIKAQLDRFTSPLVYTPGDNEWTDCHRANNGSYNPLERLAFDRSVFFPQPGVTLGEKPARVESEARAGFPENVRLREQGVSFAALHVVGSNNDLAPWTGIGNTSATPQQLAEEQARMANVVDVVRRSFADARRRHDRAVVLLLQADMFDPSFTPTWQDISAFKPLVQAIVDESSRFDGQVYLFNGDSHVYNTDRPLATGSGWLATYGVAGAADNLRRVTVDGSANNTDWLKVTINRPGAADVLRWEQVPFAP
ncbi:MAG TPA: hypothetical protein VFJ94_16275 [Intrasporangium sp.]|uniref:hypothetical protein n=1 Tax=Intrasporangium sp. TaxID=1925024 RepID=UPI002D77CED9|nr:hypothetical protein [Intrasporangium sp.]HET7400072.1 hypothetical protein [Intrasporangium sp.]